VGLRIGTRPEWLRSKNRLKHIGKVGAGKLGDLKADDRAVIFFEKSGEHLMATSIRALRKAEEATGKVRTTVGEKREVVLKGTVGSVVQREEAVRTTRHVTGVKSVTDRLRLGLLDASRRADADTEAAVAHYQATGKRSLSREPQ
jgi:hypothetical protein